jgi:hypothetical protein
VHPNHAGEITTPPNEDRWTTVTETDNDKLLTDASRSFDDQTIRCWRYDDETMGRCDVVKRSDVGRSRHVTM